MDRQTSPRTLKTEDGRVTASSASKISRSAVEPPRFQSGVPSRTRQRQEDSWPLPPDAERSLDPPPESFSSPSMNRRAPSPRRTSFRFPAPVETHQSAISDLSRRESVSFYDSDMESAYDVRLTGEADMASAMDTQSDRKESLPLRDSGTLPSKTHIVSLATSDQAPWSARTSSPAAAAAPPRVVISRIDTTQSPLRMPFGTPSPTASPTSVYTDFSINKSRDSMPISDFNLHSNRPMGTKLAHISALSTLSRDPTASYEVGSSPLQREVATPQPLHSEKVRRGLPGFGSDSRGISDRVPASRRPPNLDMGAVRDMEARGSTTSLADLIRRATRLASNLDRGKTVSRLGYYDMFGSSEKLSNKARESTYSDMLAAFPPPRLGTPSSQLRDQRQTMWPGDEKRAHDAETLEGTSLADDRVKRRQCYGMSPCAFLTVVLTCVFLIAVAVLVPVFLVVLPKMHDAAVGGTADCLESHVCHNDGVSVVVNGACSCICVDGYTGSTCTVSRDPQCIAADVTDSGHTYLNATVGNSVLPVLTESQRKFNVFFNSSVLLSTFASANLSCTSENSLVRFGSTMTKREEENTKPTLQAASPPSKKALWARFIMLDFNNAKTYSHQPKPTPTPSSRGRQTFGKRQDTGAAQTTNGIVFATSSTTGAQTTPTPTAAVATTTTATATATGTGTVGTATTAATSGSILATNTATSQQIEFAKVVVLYVLAQSQTITDAVSANQAMDLYFRSGGMSTGNETVAVKSGHQSLVANFTSFGLSTSDGKAVGLEPGA